MGHQVHITIEKIDCNKKDVFNKHNEYATWNGDYHSGIDGIRWRDDKAPFDTREECEEYIDNNCNGYINVAYRFYDSDMEFMKHKTYISLLDRRKSWEKKVSEREREIYADTVKSKYVGCKGCGSSLSRERLSAKRTNYCPLCGKDFRSESTLNAIKVARDNYKAAEEAVEKYERDYKKAHKGNMKWMVKSEFHC